jgi:GntR family transcriptional repressor for pyruvate dehydrogenase complex
VSITAYEQLAADIRERIHAGELRDGDRLPSEAALATQSKLSRATVREALRVLQEAGFVERASPRILVIRAHADEPAHRELVRALRRRNVTFRDLHEALLALDPELARLATLRATPEDLDALDAILAEQERHLTDFDAWNALDNRFHTAIGELAGNWPLLLARQPTSDLLLPALERFVRSEQATRAGLAFHHRILDEIRGGDPEGAAFMARKHINDFRRAWERSGLPYDLAVGAAPAPVHAEQARRHAADASAGMPRSSPA